MGAFSFDYTKAAGKAKPGAGALQDKLEMARPKARSPAPPDARQEVRAMPEPPAERPDIPVPEPVHIVIAGIPAEMAVPSKDGRNVRFRMKDERSETGIGYLSVPDAAISLHGGHIDADLGTEDRPVGSYWLARDGKAVRQEDGAAAIRDRMVHEMELAERHRQAGAMESPGEGRERGEDLWQKT